MPTITIDGRVIEASADATILEAARSAGIDIPTLCWYPKLTVVGNCRICLVSVEEQPKLLPYRDAIHARLSEALAVRGDQLNVKATRGEGMGFVGRLEGAAALAIATVTRPAT